MNAVDKIPARDRHACRADTPKRSSATDKTRQVRSLAMSRADFIGIVMGWSGGLVLILFISIFARYAG
jgi:hypothetical protein